MARLRNLKESRYWEYYGMRVQAALAAVAVVVETNVYEMKT